MHNKKLFDDKGLSATMEKSWIRKFALKCPFQKINKLKVDWNLIYLQLIFFGNALEEYNMRGLKKK
jgi:hypothetical protein